MSTSPVPSVLIVDDEPLARVRLLDVLADLSPEWPHKIVGSVANVGQAKKFLLNQGVDIIVLDIQMPGTTGLEWLESELKPLSSTIWHARVILLTAYPDFALKAFDLGVADYVLKPATHSRLLQACHRAMAMTAGNVEPEAKLVIRERGSTYFIDPSSILFCRAENRYTTIYTADKEWLTDLTLHELEMQYAKRFLRIHRSTLVSKDAILSVTKVDSGDDSSWQVHLKHISTPLPIARRHLAQVREQLST